MIKIQSIIFYYSTKNILWHISVVQLCYHEAFLTTQMRVVTAQRPLTPPLLCSPNTTLYCTIHNLFKSFNTVFYCIVTLQHLTYHYGNKNRLKTKGGEGARLGKVCSSWATCFSWSNDFLCCDQDKHATAKINDYMYFQTSTTGHIGGNFYKKKVN